MTYSSQTPAPILATACPHNSIIQTIHITIITREILKFKYDDDKLPTMKENDENENVDDERSSSLFVCPSLTNEIFIGQMGGCNSI